LPTPRDERDTRLFSVRARRVRNCARREFVTDRIGTYTRRTSFDIRRVALSSRIILSYHICRRVSGPSVSISVNGIASTSYTTSAFHFVTSSNRCVGRSTSRDVVSGRGKPTPARASQQSGGDATSAATLRRAEHGDAADQKVPRGGNGGVGLWGQTPRVLEVRGSGHTCYFRSRVRA